MTTTPQTHGDDLIGSATGRWTLDPAASSVSFTHPTLWGIVKVKGHFSGLRGEGRVGPDGDVSGTLAVDAASIDTNNKKRDRHLRSDHFFGADAHPEIVFEAGSARPGGPGLIVEGTLRVAGIARPLQLPVTVRQSDVDSVTLTSEISIDRADFNMTFNQAGMMRARAAVQATARFVRSAAQP